jgi:alkylation response protein AidB-like acyl-CoA dehydrogenase
MTATHTPAAAAPAVGSSTDLIVDADTLIGRARELAPVIREHAAGMERERRVARPVLDALLRAGFQGMFAPRSLGGLEVDPLTAFRVVEELARADSAAAWALQSGNVNAYWASRFSEEGIEEIYQGNANGVLVGAAFHPPNQAIEVEGGFKLSGRVPLASMIHDAGWMVFSALIMEDGKPRMTPFGPAMIAVAMPASDVEIIDTWYTLGMRGTDSNDAAFKDVFVPSRRVFHVVPDYERGRHFQGPLYRFPAVPIIALFSVAVLLAAARAAIDEFRHIAQTKVPMGSMKSLRDRGVVQAGVAEAEAKLRSARAFFVETLAATWARTSAGEPNSLEQRADVMLAGVHAAKTAAETTDLIHRLAGTTGIYESSPLERHFRDTHTLRNHGFAAENKLESVGQIYLGLPPDFPLIAF